MNKKILVIDDTETDAEMMKDFLAKEGYNVRTTGAGGTGLEEAARFKPDLILLDLILPDIDGFEVCERIRKDSDLANTKIIIISVKSDAESIGKILRVKADDYIVKSLMPHVPEDLIVKVKEQLG